MLCHRCPPPFRWTYPDYSNHAIQDADYGSLTKEPEARSQVKSVISFCKVPTEKLENLGALPTFVQKVLRQASLAVLDPPAELPFSSLKWQPPADLLASEIHVARCGLNPYLVHLATAELLAQVLLPVLGEFPATLQIQLLQIGEEPQMGQPGIGESRAPLQIQSFQPWKIL